MPSIFVRRSSSLIPTLINLSFAVLFFLLITATSFAQSSTAGASQTSRPLITQMLDESRMTTLRGNIHPFARHEFDLGSAPADLPMNRMLLVLKRSQLQESALRKALDNQQDKKSPSYHKWLTPTQFGQQYGPTDADMQTITSWLQSHGFQVGTTKGRSVLEFSGTAAEVQEAFHTSIHKYVVNGQQHWANSSDPQIPSALAPAVAGILTLHNFLKKPQLHLAEKPALAHVVPGKKPSITFSDGTHALGPQDYATIYNSPAFNGGVNGAGITIGIVGRSNLYNYGEDIHDFGGYAFACCGVVDVVLNGPDPGDLGGGEEAEATLDSTWTGAAAPGGLVDLVVSASTDTTDGVDLSEVFIIENNFADIMTESFSTCEAAATSSNALGVSMLAEQAAAQGITYIVSTGDNGSAGCDDPNSETVATGPLSVNLLASTPFNIAVGGTVFNENGSDSTYWTPGNSSNNSSVLSYISEDVWNDSCTTTSCGTNANIYAGSGGESIFVTAPSWQYGVTGIPTDNWRHLPDVSLTAAGHDPYLICLEGSCLPDSQGNFFVYFASGTSASAPAFAGFMSLIDEQMLAATGIARQGTANYVLYRLAAAENSTFAQCNGSSTSVLPDGTCTFNDVTVGNTAVPGELNYGTSTATYQAGVGYDMATGLGSVNVTNLVNNWNTVTFNPTTTTLDLNGGQTVFVAHGQSIPVDITVSPNSGTGTATGDVVLDAFLHGPVAAAFFSLTAGAVASTTNALPGGYYRVSAHYSGDATYAPSDSDAVNITVTPEASTTSVSILTFDNSGSSLPFTGGPYGSLAYLRADVVGQSQFGIATGTVTFADTFGAIPGGDTFSLNSEGNTATPNGIFNFDTGTHTISATYSGDASFTTSTTAQSQTFTITPGFYSAIAGADASVVISAPGGTGASHITVAYSSGFTGTIALACSGLPSEAACAFSPTSIAAAGTATSTAVTITVTTKAPTVASLSTHRSYLAATWIGFGFLFGAVFIGGRGRTRASLLMLMMLLILLAPACGGGGGGGSHVQTPPPDPGTPAGTSNVVVTATSGSSTSSSGFTLVVQ